MKKFWKINYILALLASVDAVAKITRFNINDIQNTGAIIFDLLTVYLLIKNPKFGYLMVLVAILILLFVIIFT